jgi:hypothetical protein
MLKSLLERAKPQLLKALEKQRIEHPSYTQYTEDYLKETYSISELKFGKWIDLRGLWLQETRHFAENPWELFEEI